MNTDKINDDDLLQVIRYLLTHCKAGEFKRFDLAQAGDIIKKLTNSTDPSLAH